MAKERNSIVELFWLISMWCVFAHHFVIHNADDISVFASPLTRLIFKGVFLPIGKVAVGCFVSIAVWFIADRASFSIKDAVKKLIILNNEVVFYSITLGIILFLRAVCPFRPLSLSIRSFQLPRGMDGGLTLLMPALFCCSPIYWRGFEPVVEASTNSFHYHYRLHLDYFDICRSFRFQPKECSSISSFSQLVSVIYDNSKF